MDPAVSVEYLDLLRDVLRDYIPPSGSFDPSGHWLHHYRLYTLVNARKLTLPTPRFGGQLSIRRTPQATGGAILNVNYQKSTQFAGMHTLLATVVCAGNDLATPLNWDSIYTAAAPAHPLKMSLEIRETGIVRDRTIFIERGTVQKKLFLSSAFTLNWSLFDAVQRLARPGGAPLRFTLLDGGDAPKPNQVLAFYQSVDLKNRWPGAPSLRVHGFLQIGDGISPQVFWVDDRGELLFLLSGLDAYVLDAGAPVAHPNTHERS
jgi:hypothetical protein